MAKTLSELRKKISPNVQAAARKKSLAMLAEMATAESQAQGINQEKRPGKSNADKPNIVQSDVPSLENT